jgi:hypothetical protein
MDITFKAENGMCPYFIYNDTKFYIQDQRQGNEWKYCLCSFKLEDQVYNFEDIKKAKEFLESKEAVFKYSYSPGDFYTSRRYNFVIKQNESKIKIIQRFNSEYESGWFDNYLDCLNWSKEYVAKTIKLSEPEQLMILI